LEGRLTARRGQAGRTPSGCIDKDQELKVAFVDFNTVSSTIARQSQSVGIDRTVPVCDAIWKFEQLESAPVILKDEKIRNEAEDARRRLCGPF
jgi:hypothetical protein